MFLQQALQVIVGLKNDINSSARMNLLRYATDDKLEALGEFYRTYRLQPKAAKVTCRITLSMAQLTATIINKGKRVTPDGVLFFALTNDVTIPAGVTFIDAEFEAVEAGTQYNDFTPGQIKNIVDPIPYVKSIENNTTSSGGTDIESDDRLRERIRLAPESFSVAGAEGAYEYWAKTADVRISDVDVSSPSPGVVMLTVLQEGGEIPSQDILDNVYAVVSPKDRRPLTDNVQVQAPTAVNYNIDFTYYILEEDKQNELNIKNAVNKAVDEFIAWQQSELGKAVNPDYLRKLVLNAGANRIVMTNPTRTIIERNTIAKAATLNVVYGGLE
jgi:phage-related baseplate assembly protein